MTSVGYLCMLLTTTGYNGAVAAVAVAAVDVAIVVLLFRSVS